MFKRKERESKKVGRVFWSNYLDSYIRVEVYVSDSNWYFRRLSDVDLEPQGRLIKAGTELSHFIKNKNTLELKVKKKR